MKSVFMCEGCGSSYETKEAAEHCESLHTAGVANVSHVEFEPLSPMPNRIWVNFDMNFHGIKRNETYQFVRVK